MSGEDRSWSPAGRPPAELAAPPVRLRGWQLGDLASLEGELERSRAHLAYWLVWAAGTDRASVAAYLLAAEAAFQARTDFAYAVLDAGGALAGGAGLHARRGPGTLEIGYWIAADRTRLGYATAAARALTAAGLALDGVDRLEIHCDEANLASAAVPRKLGYRLDRVVEKPPQAPGETGRTQEWVRAGGAETPT